MITKVIETEKGERGHLGIFYFLNGQPLVAVQLQENTVLLFQIYL